MMDCDRELFKTFWEYALHSKSGLNAVADKAYRLIQKRLTDEEREQIWAAIRKYQRGGERTSFDNVCWKIVTRLWKEKE